MHQPFAHSIRCGALARMPSQPAFQPELMPRQTEVFEYVGMRALTVVAPTTGRCYYFGYPGAMLSVDSRDVATLSGIRTLRLSRPR